jgi:hypothetical protein
MTCWDLLSKMKTRTTLKSVLKDNLYCTCISIGFISFFYTINTHDTGGIREQSS